MPCRHRLEPSASKQLEAELLRKSSDCRRLGNELDDLCKQAFDLGIHDVQAGLFLMYSKQSHFLALTRLFLKQDQGIGQSTIDILHALKPIADAIPGSSMQMPATALPETV